jgi:ABC-type phosphate transport system substrate-binding protein
MGSHGSKESLEHNLAPTCHNFIYKKNYQLTKNDYIYLCGQTKLQKERIDEIFDLFFLNNKKGYLEKNDFVELYCSLR